jgi:methylenetetrahydrofolate dehydrogenase (NADP+)/methenyltetrahydrofolate cyclohydrolase
LAARLNVSNVTAPLVLNGKLAAQNILHRLRLEVDALKSKNLRAPGLAVIQVGENPASDAYIRQKKKAAEEHGNAH